MTAPIITELTWSKWLFVIEPSSAARPLDAEIRYNAAEFAQLFFGSRNVQVAIYRDGSINLTILAQGHPVTDPRYIQSKVEACQRWARGGFGEKTIVRCPVACVTDGVSGFYRKD